MRGRTELRLSAQLDRGYRCIQPDADHREPDQAGKGQRDVDLGVGDQQQIAEPSFEPMNSPITAPITRQRDCDLRARDHERQRRAGNLIFQNVWNDLTHRGGQIEELRRSVAQSVAVLTTIGKNATSQAMASFDPMPTPSPPG